MKTLENNSNISNVVNVAVAETFVWKYKNALKWKNIINHESRPNSTVLGDKFLNEFKLIKTHVPEHYLVRPPSLHGVRR